MKPLTIEELKALQVGDWVWITTPTNKGEYYVVDFSEDSDSFVALSIHYGFDESYTDYGTKWLAYKNKEQAESEGEWVELPRIEPFSTSNFFTQEPVTAYNILYRDKASGELIIDCEVDKTEAEALLEELRGGK